MSLELFRKQVDKIYDSLGESIDNAVDELRDDLANAFTTNDLVTSLLTVTGNATLEGGLTLSALGGGILQTDAEGVVSTTTVSAGSIAADSLDFTQFMDALTLDASTDIAVAGSNVLSITNAGTGNSFLVNDEAGDTSPFVIDASGNVGIGTAGPSTPLAVGPVSSALNSLATNAAATISGASASTMLVEGTSAGASAGGGITLYNNNGGTILSGYRLGSLTLGGASAASSLRNTASVAAHAEQNWVDASAYGTYLAFSTTNNNATGRTEKMRISADGNVGIGDTTPDDLLNIHSASAAAGLAITSLGTDTDPYLGFQLADGTNTFTIGIDDSDSDKFKISGAALGTNDRLVIDASGNVGIGTTTPARRLQVLGTSATNSGIVLSNTGAGTNAKNFSWALDNNGTFYGQLNNDNYTSGQTNWLTLTRSAATPVLLTLIVPNTTFTGNVGIGTTSPQTSLHAYSSSGSNQFRAQRNGDDTYLDVGVGTTYAILNVANNSAGLLDIQDDGTSRLFINASGNVGIGTTNPAQKLQVGGNIVASSTYPQIYVQDTGTVLGGIRADRLTALELKTLTTAPLSFQVNSSEKLRIIDTGNVGIGTTNPNEGKLEVKGGTVCVDTNSDDSASSCIASESDERLKTNVVALGASSSLDILRALNPVSFDWKVSDPEVLEHYPLIARFANNAHSIGLIAQEVQPLLPEAIELETVGDDDVQYLQLDYTKFVPLLIKGFQELDARVSALGDHFVDGVLTLTEARIEYVRADYIEGREANLTERLCIEDVCVTADELRALLGEDNESDDNDDLEESDQQATTSPDNVPPVPMTGSSTDPGLDDDLDELTGDEVLEDDLSDEPVDDDPLSDDLVVPPADDLTVPASAF